MPTLKVKDKYGNFVKVPTVRGEKGEDGDRGLNAYDLWLSEGNIGTLNDFYRMSLNIFISTTEPINPTEGLIWIKPTPPEIPLDFKLRFDASRLVLLNNVEVLRWKNLNGDGNDLITTQTTKPIFLSGGLNGKPTVQFLNTTMDTDYYEIDNPSEITVFMVGAFDNLVGSRTLMGYGVIGSSAPSHRYYLRYSSSAQKIQTTIANVVLSSIPLADTNPFLLTTEYDKVENTTYKDGVFIESKPHTSGMYSTDDRFRVGGSLGTSEFFSGRISEIIIYPRVLNAEELNQIHVYLKTKWGII